MSNASSRQFGLLGHIFHPGVAQVWPKPRAWLRGVVRVARTSVSIGGEHYDEGDGENAGWLVRQGRETGAFRWIERHAGEAASSRRVVRTTSRLSAAGCLPRPSGGRKEFQAFDNKRQQSIKLFSILRPQAR